VGSAIERYMRTWAIELTLESGVVALNTLGCAGFICTDFICHDGLLLLSGAPDILICGCVCSPRASSGDSLIVLSPDLQLHFAGRVYCRCAAKVQAFRVL
jgi:hypothetical protein